MSPTVDGRKFPYTPAGMKAAAKAKGPPKAKPPVDRGKGKANAPGQIKKGK